jgi:hypothetical protein
MGAWQLARAKAPLLVLLCLLCGLAMIDLVVSAEQGWDTFGGVEQSQTFSRLEQASAKALGLASAQRRGAHVGLVIGMSTADWGIGLRQLEAADSSLRWAKVTGEFSSFSNLLEIVRRFDHAGVAASRTLLCVHYGMLLGARRHKSTWTERVHQLLERTSQSGSTNELGRVVTLSWLGNNRAGAANALELRLGSLRERLLTSLSQPAELVFPRLADPFEDSLNVHAPMNPNVRERHVKNFTERWRLARGAGSGKDEAAQTQALTQIVELLGRRPGLLIVLMPEHSALRTVEPEPFAGAMLASALAAAKLPEPPAVLDLRSSLPDPYFADEVHATAAGRPVLTAALARGLAERP